MVGSSYNPYCWRRGRQHLDVGEELQPQVKSLQDEGHADVKKGIGFPSPEIIQTEILEGAMVVDKILVLGVIISSDLGVEEHLCKTLSTAASSLYALRTLRSLTGQALHVVAKATTIAQVMYASPAWWGYTTVKTGTKLTDS